MSKRNYRKPENKVVIQKKESINPKKEEIESKAAEYWDKKYEKEKPEFIFGKTHFIIISAALTLIIVGFFLMSGGAMTDESKWDASKIYSFTRITLAPLLVLLGLAAVGYAIFYNDKSEDEKEQKLEKES
jgi:hypothetical protein